MQQTDDEVLAKEISAMGPELGKLYHVISKELCTLHWRWGEYRILFGEEPRRIELMNRGAPFFFSVVHDAISESTLLGIARLVGSETSCGKPNLSIRRLVSLVDGSGLKAEIEVLVEEANAAADFATEWRNRHIAHRDLKLALDTSPDALPLATREKIELALAALREVMTKIENAYCHSDTAYALSPWGAKALLYLLQGGLLREEEKRAAWARGDPNTAMRVIIERPARAESSN